MDNLRELFSGLVYWIIWVVGVRFYPWWSSRIIIVTTLALGWHHMKLCMEEGVKHHCVGIRMENR